jgi:hypothetical protein
MLIVSLRQGGSYDLVRDIPLSTRPAGMQSTSRGEGVREVRREPEIVLAVADARIAWVLEYPHMSAWLKQALRSADGLDPIGLQNDVERLGHLIVTRSQARIEIAMALASNS